MPWLSVKFEPEEKVSFLKCNAAAPLIGERERKGEPRGHEGTPGRSSISSSNWEPRANLFLRLPAVRTVCVPDLSLRVSYNIPLFHFSSPKLERYLSSFHRMDQEPPHPPDALGGHKNDAAPLPLLRPTHDPLGDANLVVVSFVLILLFAMQSMLRPPCSC